MAKTLVYQMWPISWDSLERMTEHLARVQDLGATHIWLSPLYESPRADHGYDISDYKKIDKRFGTMRDFDHFVTEAHKLGLQVVMDMVLNHTSTEHPWFLEHPEYYCLEDEPINGWGSLFGGSAWEYSEEHGKYYCHLFDKRQADLRWFEGNINNALVKEFRSIVELWLSHGVDGFRLDVPQSINKNFAAKELNLSELLFGEEAISVINAVFSGLGKKPFLMMECLDPTFGEIVEKYVKCTPVDYCLNILLKEERDKGSLEFDRAFKKSISFTGFMLDLESHDSPRFTSRSGMLPRQIAQMMFKPEVEAICIYQGQELGLKNPRNLTADYACVLDAQTAIHIQNGANEEEELKKSRANARMPLPLWEYAIQKKNKGSSYNDYKSCIENWKKARA